MGVQEIYFGWIGLSCSLSNLLTFEKRNKNLLLKRMFNGLVCMYLLFDQD